MAAAARGARGAPALLSETRSERCDCPVDAERGLQNGSWPRAGGPRGSQGERGRLREEESQMLVLRSAAIALICSFSKEGQAQESFRSCHLLAIRLACLLDLKMIIFLDKSPCCRFFY